jgi:hypothetical protein
LSISFRAVSSTAGADTTAVTIPADVQPGDALLLLTAVNSSATITAPAGWSSVDTRSTAAATAKVLTRVAQPGDAGAPVIITNDGPPTGESVAVIAAYAGTDAVAPVHLSAGATAPGSVTAHTVPSVTTTGSTWVVHAAAARSAGTPWTAPITSTVRAQHSTTGATQVSAVVTDRNVSLPPGATGTPALTSATATADAFTWTIALAPAVEVDPLFPDTEGLLVSYLQGRPELTGVPVALDLPPNDDGTTPYVIVSRIGGGYQADGVLEYAWLRVDTYAASRESSHELIRRVRSVLRGLTSAHLPGSVFSDITEELGGRGLRRLTDSARPNANRYALNFWAWVRLS